MSDIEQETLNKLIARVALLRYVVLGLCEKTFTRREATKFVESLAAPLPTSDSETEAFKVFVEDEIAEFSELLLRVTEKK